MPAYERVEGFPKVRSTKDGNAVTDQVWGTWEDILTVEDTYALGSECPFDSSLILESIDKERKRDGNRGLATLNYAPEGTGGNFTDSGQEEYTAESIGSQEALETLPQTKYYMKWNNQLVKKKGATDFSDPDDRLKEIPSATYPDNKWIPYDEQCPDGWVVQQKATKPGIRTYVAGKPVIHGTKFYSDAKKAGTALVNVGKTSTPAQCFGLPAAVDGKATFLIVGTQISKEGRKWVVRTDYQYSPTGWDSDIYDAVT